MESRSESKERPRPMSSSSDDEDDEGYLIVKASSFRQKSFWTWAKGVDFLTIPFTGTKIRCVLGVLEENLEDVDVPCRECVEVWERSGLRDSLQSVQWRGAELLSQDPRLTLFLMACQAAKDYTFMDGVSKILSIRMLDLVLSHGLCHTHIRSLTVVSPSSMFEVGALEAKALLCREGERGVKVELKGRPDVAVLASGLALNNHLSILLGENKSTTYPNGLSQLIFYLLLAQLKNLTAGAATLFKTTGVYMSPNKLQTVTATPHPHHEEPGPRVVEINVTVDVERNISEGGLLHIIEKMWVGLASIEHRSPA